MKQILFIYIYKVIFILALVHPLGAQSAMAQQASNLKINSNDSGRAHLSLNKQWSFAKSDIDLPLNKLDTLDWADVALPHTPKIEPLVVNNQWKGVAFYRRTVDKKESWENKTILLKFEGAMRVADVWLNGIHLYRNYGGFLPFTVDITNHLTKRANNTLLVKLNNHDLPTTGPKPLHLLDFTTYGGLYRGVSLVVQPPIHITDEIHVDTKNSGGITINYPSVTADKAIVSVDTHISNKHSEFTPFTLKQSLFLGDMEIVSKELVGELQAGQNKQFNLNLEVEKPELWSPNAPNLYELVTQISVNQIQMDVKKTTLGIRNFSFDQNNNLLINNEKTFLRGINRHQEYPHIGYALSDAAQFRDALKIKSAGFDYVRVAHYPMSPAFMSATDQLGLVVLNAIPGWQYYSHSPQFKEYIIEACRKMIRRDRNHPSVLAWECSLNETDMPPNTIKELHNTVKEEMPTAYSAGWTAGYDIYLQARQHRLQHYTPPQVPYIVSEYGDWEYFAQNAGLAQDSWADLLPNERSSRQLLSSGEKRLLQKALNVQEAHNDNFNIPAFADGYWVMFDYNRGYADDLEASGIMSIHRLPKFSYYFFQSQRPANVTNNYADVGPMVYIASNWNDASSSRVTVFSNAQQVELFLNGRSLGRKDGSENALTNNLTSKPFIFETKEFEPGTLKAIAYIEDKLVATHQVDTAGEGVSLTINVDTSRVPLQLDQQDTVFVYANLLDKLNNQSKHSGTEVIFETSGDISLVGLSKTTTQNGIAAVLLRVGESLIDACIIARLPSVNYVSEPFCLENLENGGSTLKLPALNESW